MGQDGGLVLRPRSSLVPELLLELQLPILCLMLTLFLLSL